MREIEREISSASMTLVQLPGTVFMFCLAPILYSSSQASFGELVRNNYSSVPSVLYFWEINHPGRRLAAQTGEELQSDCIRHCILLPFRPRRIALKGSGEYG